jgi:hypothetical protein
MLQDLHPATWHLVTECNVSLNKVNSVISTVLHKLSGILPDRLPSMAVKSRLLIEAKAVAQQHIGDIIHSLISFEYFPFSNVTI